MSNKKVWQSAEVDARMGWRQKQAFRVPVPYGCFTRTIELVTDDEARPLRD